MAAPTVTKHAIQRAIEAAQATGLAIGSVTVCPRNGSIKIETATVSVSTMDTAASSGQAKAPKQWKTR